MCDHEQNAIIQEEIGRLPAKYRAPVVLCYLEGLTHEMAAEHLGWPVGSVKSRLARARERLRIRLTKRGLGQAAIALERPKSWEGLAPGSAMILFGQRLNDVTVRGALNMGTGKAALAKIVSTEAIVLMEGVIRSMTTARLMLTATAVLLTGLITSGAYVMGYAMISQQTAPSAANAGQDVPQPVAATKASQVELRTAAANPTASQRTVVIPVEVVDAEGRPLAGADVVADARYVRSGDEITRKSSSARKPMARGTLSSNSCANDPARHSGRRVFWRLGPGMPLPSPAPPLPGNLGLT